MWRAAASERSAGLSSGTFQSFRHRRAGSETGAPPFWNARTRRSTLREIFSSWRRSAFCPTVRVEASMKGLPYVGFSRCLRLHAAWAVAVLSSAIVQSEAQSPQIVQVNTAQVWRRVEFQVNNVPTATNRFDPDVIRLDATFTAPSGRAMVVPGFWFQNYVRSLSGGFEQLSHSGAASWRIRFAPQETGNYSLALVIVTNGVAAGPTVTTNFTVLNTNPLARTGYVQVAPGQQYFRTGDGQPLRL